MAVQISPVLSVVIRKKALVMHNIERSKIETIGLVFFSEDRDLVVLGPFYDVEKKEIELEQYDDFFEITNSGGDVPEWCSIKLSLI
ncbi:MAG: hypothetical protein CSA81_12240 [Acidobacteria bacterium]|nr:MAG: hypothetical protein CSA81_12240 [Acidobacteriota bacterium]